MDDSKGDSSTNVTSVLTKACENCRVRKIRCDRSDPCSNCKVAGIACRPAARIIEHRPRVNLSSRYEKQIEAIHERLLGIENSLFALRMDMKKSTIEPGREVAASEHATSIEPQEAFEGDSSFSKHSLQASHAAELTASGTSGRPPDVEVTDALKSLHTLLRTKHTGPSENNLRFSGQPTRSLSEGQLLPADFVLLLLRKVKERTPISFLTYAWRDHFQLERLCQKVYFPTEPVSPATLTMMHGMFVHLIQEYLEYQDPDILNFDCESYLKFCERQFYKGIETYETLTVPSFENVQCLVIGIVQAQEASLPSLCWALTAAAARSCQALGYHRKSALENDSFLDAESKRHLFWTVYMFDKNMSLNLGRAAAIQDYDIDVDLYTPTPDPSILPWDLCALAYVKFAKLQGQIYDKIYSAGARRASADERKTIIDELRDSLEGWRGDFGKIDIKKACHPTLCENIIGPLDVVYYSVLTQLHRIPSTSTNSASEVNPECFSAAKTTLEIHLKHYYKFLNDGRTTRSYYINWTLLYSSFTPFIVVFQQTIASRNKEHLKLLDDVVKSLDHFRDVSEATERLYQTCNVFFRVAKALIVSKETEFEDQDSTDPSLMFLPGVGDYSLPDFFSQDALNARSADFNGMSNFFDTLLRGNQPAQDLLNLDLIDNS